MTSRFRLLRSFRRTCHEVSRFQFIGDAHPNTFAEGRVPMMNRYRIAICLLVLMFSLRVNAFGEEDDSEIKSHLQDFVTNCQLVRENYSVIAKCAISGASTVSFGGVEMNWFLSGFAREDNKARYFMEIRNEYSHAVTGELWERYYANDPEFWMSRGRLIKSKWMPVRPPEYDEDTGKLVKPMPQGFRPPNSLTMTMLPGTNFMAQRDQVDVLADFVKQGVVVTQTLSTEKGSKVIGEGKVAHCVIEFSEQSGNMPTAVQWYVEKPKSFDNPGNAFCEIQSQWRAVEDQEGVSLWVPVEVTNVLHRATAKDNKTSMHMEIQQEWKLGWLEKGHFSFDNLETSGTGEGPFGNVKNELDDKLKSRLSEEDK